MSFEKKISKKYTVRGKDLTKAALQSLREFLDVCNCIGT